MKSIVWITVCCGLIRASSLVADASTWTADTSTNWGVDSNWDPDTGFPNDSGADVTFPDLPSCVVDGSFQVNSLTFDTSSLTLSAAGLGNQLTIFSSITNMVAGTSPTISCPLVIPSSLSLLIGDTDTATLTISSPMSGAGSLLISGGGLLFLSGANTYAGSTTITEIETLLEDDGSFPTTTDLILDGAIVDLSGINASSQEVASISGEGAIVLGSKELIFGTAASTSFSGQLSGSGGTLTKQGSGTFSFLDEGERPDFTFFTDVGTIEIQEGTFALTSSPTEGLNHTTFVVDSSGVLDISAAPLCLVKGLSGEGTVLLGEHVLQMGQSNTTFAGVITGGNSSQFLKAGPGTTQFLSGANTYTGLTRAAIGTIALTGDGTLASTSNLTIDAGQSFFDISAMNASSLTIANLIGGANARFGPANLVLGSKKFIFGASSNTAFFGVISGSGGQLTKQGSGKTSLTAASTYTGATEVLAGTLALSGAGALAAVTPLTVTSPGTFDISGKTASSQTVASLTGSGSVILGANTLIFGDGSNKAFSGAISGTNGQISKQGSGIATFSGISTYTGVTSVQAGTLVLSGSGTLSSATGIAVATAATFDISAKTASSQTVGSLSGTGDVVLGSKELIFGDSSNTTFGGVASGSGGQLTKQGSGSIKMSGTNTYTGLTTIAAGILSINDPGSLAGDVTVGASGTLKGTGTINGDVTVDGILSPGNSIGTITIGGDLNLNSSSITQISIAADGSCSLINVGGEAFLDGQLEVEPQPGTYSPSLPPYVILTSTGLRHGAFTFTSPPGFSLGVAYFAHSVELTFLSIGINTTGLTGNRLIIANYLNGLVSEDLGGLFTELTRLSGGALDKALDAISPSRNSFTTFMSQNVMIELSDNVSSRLSMDRYHHLRNENKELAALWDGQEALMADASDEVTGWPRSRTNKKKAPLQKSPVKERRFYNVWGSAFGDFAKEKASKQNPAFNIQSGGLLVGMDLISVNNHLFGFASGYVGAKLHEASDFGKGEFNGAYLSAYGQGQWGGFFLEGAAWGAYQNVSNERHVWYTALKPAYPNCNKKAKSSHNCYQVNPHLSFGYQHRYKTVTIEPFISGDWVFNFEEGFSETGADPYNMKQSGKTSSMVRAETGLNAFGEILFAQSFLLIRGRGSYVYKQLLHTGKITAALVGFPGSFTVNSLTGHQNLGLGSLELSWHSLTGCFISALYTGEFGSGYSSNQIVGRIGKRF